jgi:hypothetical protein
VTAARRGGGGTQERAVRSGNAPRFTARFTAPRFTAPCSTAPRPRLTPPAMPARPRTARSSRPGVVRRLALTPHASRQLDALAARWGLEPRAIVSIAVDAWAQREAALAGRAATLTHVAAAVARFDGRSGDRMP